MLYVQKVLEVELLIIPYLDNKVAKELMENRSVGEQTRYSHVQFLSTKVKRAECDLSLVDQQHRDE
jgi:hypothetical protein